MIKIVRPDAVKIAVYLLAVNSLFSVFLFYNHGVDITEVTYDWKLTGAVIVKCVFWLLLAWKIYAGQKWAKNTALILIAISVAFTVMSLTKGVSEVTSIELFLSGIYFIVFVLLQSPSAQEWIKSKP